MTITKKNTTDEIINDAIVDRVIEVVNRAIKADPSAVHALFENRVPCNQRLANDQEIQVATENKDVGYVIGVLGLLSGIVGTCTYRGNKDYSKIWAVYNVDCPVHGTNGDEWSKEEVKVGDSCPVKGCEEELILGNLLYLERVPEDTE